MSKRFPLVKKNILKSTSYKCYCTGMNEKNKSTRDHVTDQIEEIWYQVSNHFHLESSKYLKCVCIISSALNVKETSINVRQIGFIYINDHIYFYLYAHTHTQTNMHAHFFKRRRTLQEWKKVSGTQKEDNPPEWWLLMTSGDSVRTEGESSQLTQNWVN